MKKIVFCKGIVSLLLCLLMMLTCVPSFALAESKTPLTLGGLSQVTVEPDSEVICSFTPSQTGYYRFYSVSGYDPHATLLDANMEELYSNDDSWLGENECDFSLKYKLEASKVYYLKIAIFDDDAATFDVMVEESVSAVSAKLLEEPSQDTIIKGFEIETMCEYGVEVEFTLSDGSKEVWDADMDNIIAYSYVSFQPLEKITVGSEEESQFVLEVTCDDVVLEIPYQVIENPVKSISYKGEGLSFYKDTCGYFEYTEDDETVFIYEYFVWDQFVTVEYTDGSSEEFELSDLFPYTKPIVYDYQDESPWQVGKNEIIVSYLGEETTIPVTILPCPFKSVTINSNPTTEYIFGNMENGDMFDEGYYFDIYDLTGLSVTFENTDGSKVTYTADDFDMDLYELDGYEFEMDSAFCEQPGMADCTLYYKGFEVPFRVKVVESSVANLEILGDADKLIIEDAYAPVLDGLSVKVTMKDGTSQTVKLNEEIVEYEIQWGLRYRIPVGEYTVYGYIDYDMDDNVYLFFYCLDQTAEYNGFSFTPTREIDDIKISDFALDGDGMGLTITYENGDKETLKVKKLFEYDEGFYSDYLGLTENGVLEYSIAPDYQGEEEGYSVEVLNQWVFVPFEGVEGMGDLNDDDKVDAKDALQVLKYAVGKAEFTVVQEVKADVNEDGDINAKDALEILKKAVNKPSALDQFYAE